MRPLAISALLLLFDIPLAATLGGGYSLDTANVVAIHLATLEALVAAK